MSMFFFNRDCEELTYLNVFVIECKESDLIWNWKFENTDVSINIERRKEATLQDNTSFLKINQTI